MSLRECPYCQQKRLGHDKKITIEDLQEPIFFHRETVTRDNISREEYQCTNCNAFLYLEKEQFFCNGSS